MAKRLLFVLTALALGYGVAQTPAERESTALRLTGNILSVVFHNSRYECDQTQMREGFHTVCITSPDQTLTRIRVDEALEHFNQDPNLPLPNIQILTPLTEWREEDGVWRREYYIEPNPRYNLTDSLAAEPFYVYYTIDTDTLYIDVTRP